MSPLAIPDLNEEGLLPPGDHGASLEEFHQSFVVQNRFAGSLDEREHLFAQLPPGGGGAAIYSMATSSAAEAPRGMDFLYSLNRLNVAISRAQGMAVLICSPALLDVKAHTPVQMRLANALCRLVEVTHASSPRMAST